ncbi:MAG TPA: class I mannose-6-phosphate isomerase [Propionibacteriaceae bacterium]|nr:class I mannose-6-phosphate isomerase [Propionibacteriaceae bacterium]
MDVILLPSNRPAERFYRGGRKITEFRGEPPAGDREPEDWVGSTTTLAGEESLGLSTLPDGQLLKAAIEAEPEAWLGAPHVERFGADTRLLVKLLDAAQRLPVHAHPDVSFAAQHLGRAHGKAEAWFIVDGGEVYLGLKHDVMLDELKSLVMSQEVTTMRGLLHRIAVHPGDVVYVPPGVLHAPGEGIFLVELQEPEDLSILLEWQDFELDGEHDGHLGLGFDLALQAVECRSRSAEEISQLVRPAGFGSSVLPEAADRYFRLARVALDGEAALDPGFAVLVVLSGKADLAGEQTNHLTAGNTAVVPNAFGPLRFRGRAELLVCRPPRPQ